MNQNLGITFDTPIKFVIRNLSVLNANLMRHDKARLRLARNDQVAKIPIVSLHIALASGQFQALRNVS